MIDDAYKMWYIAIKRFGLPYAWGEYGTAGNRRGMEEALELMYAGGYAVVPAGDKINLLNLASASSFQAFESKINKQREEIYLAVRGGYLPFLEGSGSGGDAHGNTETSKVATDAGEVTDGFHVAHQIQLQLGRVLMDVNEGPDVDVPELSLGGTNPGEVKQQGDNLKLADELLEGKISIEKVVEKMSHAVATCFQIKERGFIREGYYADLVLVDMNRPNTVSKKNILTPFCQEADPKCLKSHAIQQNF